MSRPLTKWLYIILASAVILFAFLAYLLPDFKQFSSPYFIRDFILQFGNMAAVAYVLLLTLAVPIPSPSAPFILAGGFVFGTVKGLILSLIGEVLGATIAFYLVRIAGRPLLYKLASKRQIKKFDEFFRKKGIIAAFVSFAIPVLPSDVVSLSLGLTKIKYPLFLALVIIGHIPRLLLISYVGADLYNGLTGQTFLIIASMIILSWMIYDWNLIDKCIGKS